MIYQGRIPKYPEPLTLNSLDSIRVDVLCKCFLKNEEFEEEGKKIIQFIWT